MNDPSKIVVAGHVCLDIIPEWNSGTFEDIAPGRLVMTDGMIFSTGGVVSNTGISLKKLGMEPILIGKIGDDLIGKLITDVFEANGKDLSSHLKVDKNERSSYTLVLSPPDLDRAFLHFSGANASFCAEDIDFDRIKGAGILHFGYPPVMKRIRENDGAELVKIFDRAHAEGMVTGLDMTLPVPNYEPGIIDWMKFFENVLPHTDIFAPSLYELLYMLSREEGLSSGLLTEISDRMVNFGVKILMVKLGENGIYLRTSKPDGSLKGILSEEWPDREMISPAFTVKAAGTTGSGDAAIAGFLSALSKGFDPETSLNFASAVGAFCVEAVDSTGGIKPSDEVLERMKKGWQRLPMKSRFENWRYGKDGVLLSARDRKK